MTNQLPPEFFTRFFAIFDFSPQQAVEYQATINQLCQRAFVYQQLQVLPDRERTTYTNFLEQEDISPQTISDFIEALIPAETQEQLWQQALLQVWQEIFDSIGKSATAAQKDQVRELLRQYSEE